MSIDYTSAITSAAQKYGVPTQIALSVAQAESSMNPSAVSSAGAIGLFQLMPATAAGLGVNPYDPIQNIDGGVRYLSQLYSRFGDWTQALAAYNFGPGNVGSGKDWPSETVNYVKKVLSGAWENVSSIFETTPPVISTGTDSSSNPTYSITVFGKTISGDTGVLIALAIAAGVMMYVLTERKR